jgi:RND family efflux transporter MFP subunit
MRRNTRMLIALTAVLIAACSRHEPPAGAVSAAAPVRAVPVESAPVAAQVRAVGVLAPRDEIRLAFKVGGVIDSIAVEAGDPVQRGQLLAVLKRGEIDASVAQAAEGVQKSRRDLERAARLRADEVTTDEQVQDLTSAYNVARANLDAARFNARFARIEAPADGIVLARLAQADELVQGGQPILLIGDTSTGWVVKTALADRDAVRVELGAAAEVTFDAFPGQSFAGKVTRIAAASDPMTGTFEVEIDVSANGARFARGLVGKVTLDLDATDAATATLIPVSSLVEANGRSAIVFVLDAKAMSARRKQITVGAIVGHQVVVSGGLELGEQVITDGAAWLTDGRSVRVVADRG